MIEMEIKFGCVFKKADDTTFNSNYRYACHQTNNGGTESSITSTGNTQWRMTGGTAGGNTAVFGGCFGHMYVHNPFDPQVADKVQVIYIVVLGTHITMSMMILEMLLLLFAQVC